MKQRAFDRLVDSIRKLDTTGTILDPGQKLDLVVKALYKNPFRFFSASNEYFRQAHRVQTMGTGFLITGDGYIITNSHIIDRDSAFIRNKFILSTFHEVTEANINALQSSWEMRLNDQQRNMLNDAYGLIYSQVSSMILFDLKREFNVLCRSFAIKKPARVVVKGQPMPGKDVAILKVDESENLPTLSFSQDSMVRIGAEVLVLGYPEPATSNTFLAQDASIEPSLTAGIVSAIKKSVGGWPVIQMDAMISHGSSGSPVCNDKGEVIGIATFGSIDQGGGTLASGFNFAIPVSVMKEFIRLAGIQPKMSEASRRFNEGLTYFYQQFYRKAEEKFKETKVLNPLYPQLDFYLEQCNKRIDGGSDRQSPPRKYVFWIMIAIAISTVVYLFMRMHRQRKLI
jgi:hypothetical protein